MSEREREHKQVTDEAEKCGRYSVAIAVCFLKGLSGKCNPYIVATAYRANKQRTEDVGKCSPCSVATSVPPVPFLETPLKMKPFFF